MKKILTEDQENFIMKNYTLMTGAQIADYLDLKEDTIWGFCSRKGLKGKRNLRNTKL